MTTKDNQNDWDKGNKDNKDNKDKTQKNMTANFSIFGETKMVTQQKF